MSRWRWAFLVAAACGSGGTDPSLATLTDAAGAVQASRDTDDSWSAAPTGTRFRRGDAVRTLAASSARVQMLRGGGALAMGADSLVRFGGGGPASQRIELETGEATIETGEAEIVLETADGPATLTRGAQVLVRRGPDGLQFEVVVGTARIERSGVPLLELSAGDRVALGAGPARPVAPADAGVARVKVDAAAAPAPAPAPGLRLGKRPITIADPPAQVAMGVSAGATAVIHDPGPQTAVRLARGDHCPGDTVVEVVRGRRRSYFRGRDAIAIELGTGRNKYRLLCAEDDELRASGAGGVLRVLRDAGTAKVKTRAPANTVEADGRKYTLLYQNAKPTITFVWPKAPRAAGYTLTITPRRGSPSRISTKDPTHAVASGKLAEGSYKFQFATPGGDRSPETALVIDFDNAAPVAELERTEWNGTSFEVRGLATEGSTVSIGGIELPLDAHHRFQGRVMLEPGQKAVSVRIVRPGGSVHYYVRRAPRPR